jgi:cystathionine beta-lyase/cystathionine gamma-synthase
MMEPSLATLAVHAGEKTSIPDFVPTCTPIHNAVTYTYGDMHAVDAILAGQREGYVYSRFANPTVVALEHAIAQLEGTEAALACASGMSALHLALLAAGVRPGSAVLAAEDLYGGTHSLLVQLLASHAVRVETTDLTDLRAVAQVLRQIRPIAVLTETISNPLLRVIDVPALASLVHQVGAELIVDNTVATPCLYRPALHGADYVVSSATKYLGGHGDVMAGVIASSKARCHRARELQRLVGSILGPNEAWLVLRGLKTLFIRMRQQSQNAGQVARFLSVHPRIEPLFYPGLPTHPQFQLCRRLFPSNLYGGLVSFELQGAREETVFRFMDALRLIVPAASLGDVTSLMLYPAHSSHRSLSEEERRRRGVTANLVRLSVGIEEASDIIADLAQALDSQQVWRVGVDQPRNRTERMKRGTEPAVRQESSHSE